MTLDFVLTCTIRLGTAPTNTECATRKLTNSDLSGLAGRKRRQTDETEFTQTTGLYDFSRSYIDINFFRLFQIESFNVI